MNLLLLMLGLLRGQLIHYLTVTSRKELLTASDVIYVIVDGHYLLYINAER